MPSFVCDHCQETLKKAKLDQHAHRCRNAVFSCIDCYKNFKGVEYRDHFSCITEVQKYHQKTVPVAAVAAKTVVNKPTTPTVLASTILSAATVVKKPSESSSFAVALKKILKSSKSSNSVNLKVIKKQLKKALGKSSAKKSLQEQLFFSINPDTNEIYIKLE